MTLKFAAIHWNTVCTFIYIPKRLFPTIIPEANDIGGPTSQASGSVVGPSRWGWNAFRVARNSYLPLLISAPSEPRQGAITKIGQAEPTTVESDNGESGTRQDLARRSRIVQSRWNLVSRASCRGHSFLNATQDELRTLATQRQQDKTSNLLDGTVPDDLSIDSMASSRLAPSNPVLGLSRIFQLSNGQRMAEVIIHSDRKLAVWRNSTGARKIHVQSSLCPRMAS
ncbi:hypothetical protein BJ170DRAFT_594145 [Xylariales sp. AK1849]|nr:hypothetical protein BJ170DRAFT_594145 [Xylariales sp. AK1849]